ncbi:MAG: (d)CMP kinase [Lachnospiraceae bacterium]|nr:(d)CMP kinase [Lachnospiraceae bacterium]
MNKSIAVDGPAGAGKSTIAKRVAQNIGYIYVDTGAMYRAIALYVLRNKIDYNDELKVGENINEINVTLDYVDNTQIVLLNGENVNDYIRTSEVSNVTSKIATYAAVREKLLDLQRNLAVEKKVIMDGRDIGTNVLPDAFLKIYLTATPEARADRRYKELVEKGEDCNYDTILKDIIARDNQDMNREIAPLKQAQDAVLVDSSNMGIEEVTDTLVNIYKEKESL